MMLIGLRQCVFGYAGVPIVQVDDLQLRAGQSLGVFGPNGCGKTTLVRGIIGLLAPLEGAVQRASGLRFGYLPQQRAMGLDWPMSGIDAAAMAISAQRRFGWLGHAASRLRPHLRLLDVEGLAPRPFAKLSGGQQQRLLLAGALAAEPQVLVLDEAAEGLDVRSRQVFLSALRQATAGGLCIVSISHSIEDVMALGDQVAWVHLSEEPGQPNRVEIISPPAFAERVLTTRQVL